MCAFQTETGPTRACACGPSSAIWLSSLLYRQEPNRVPIGWTKDGELWAPPVLYEGLRPAPGFDKNGAPLLNLDLETRIARDQATPPKPRALLAHSRPEIEASSSPVVQEQDEPPIVSAAVPSNRDSPTVSEPAAALQLQIPQPYQSHRVYDSPVSHSTTQTMYNARPFGSYQGRGRERRWVSAWRRY